MIAPEKVKNVDAHHLLPPKQRSDDCNRMRVELWVLNGALWAATVSFPWRHTTLSGK